jgi:predicted 3-demethylubiquinone-9 3-methyltransferase (glyoxalase superfamily)
MLHNFKCSLSHEREQAEKADRFYREVLKASEIKRFNTDTEADMVMQRQDVDLLLTLNGVVYRIPKNFVIKTMAICI